MFRLLCLALLAIALSVSAQESIQPQEPHNPRDYFDIAAPTYNFNDPSLKPWHLKATYVVYGNDSSSTQGTFEHWWASPRIYRNSWMRAGVVHTDWHTDDDKHAYLGEGTLDYFEYALQSAVLSPLPLPKELDPAKVRLEREDVQLAGFKFPCIKVIPLMPQHGQVQQVPLGLFPTYCFDNKATALRIEFSWGSLATEFDHIVKFQGRYLPRQITILEGKRKILSATIDNIEEISPSDPALVPPPDVPAVKQDKVQLAAGIANGMLVKKQTPVYPQDAKDAHVSGRVILQGVIGRDGVVHDLRVVETPWPSLTASSLWAVSQWHYKPYLLNGQPIEVETTINVIYSLGN